MKKKYPDQIVFDYDKQIYDSNIKNFQLQSKSKF